METPLPPTLTPRRIQFRARDDDSGLPGLGLASLPPSQEQEQATTRERPATSGRAID